MLRNVKRNYAGAEAEFRQAIRLAPDNVEFHNALGGLLCDVKGDYTGAEAEFRQWIRLEPDSGAAHYCLGNRERPGEGARVHRRVSPGDPPPTRVRTSAQQSRLDPA